MTPNDIFYAGIGARSTPDYILNDMFELAKFLKERNFCLRSGGAKGADQAFEAGVGFQKEIFIPFENFNGYKLSNNVFSPNKESFKIAEHFHPNWKSCKEFARYAHARNAHIVLGKNLKTPVKFVCCFTLNSDIIGGTGLAIRIANEFKIPVFNFGTLSLQKIKDEISNLIIEK